MVVLCHRVRVGAYFHSHAAERTQYNVVMMETQFLCVCVVLDAYMAYGASADPGQPQACFFIHIIVNTHGNYFN